MNKTEDKDSCTSCVHFNYCMVFWGVECKRQGGKRIPKMKPTPANIIENNPRIHLGSMDVSLQKTDAVRTTGQKKSNKPKSSYKQDMLKRIVQIFEPIRTKAVNW